MHYHYAYNSPIQWKDPSGLATQDEKHDRVQELDSKYMIDGYGVGYWWEVQDAMFFDEPIAPNWDAIDETCSEMQRWNDYCRKVMMIYGDYDLGRLDGGGILNFVIRKLGIIIIVPS
jgi:hypothetical protein